MKRAVNKTFNASRTEKESSLRIGIFESCNNILLLKNTGISAQRLCGHERRTKVNATVLGTIH